MGRARGRAPWVGRPKEVAGRRETGGAPRSVLASLRVSRCYCFLPSRQM
jgi:hypothetical protein